MTDSTVLLQCRKWTSSRSSGLQVDCKWTATACGPATRRLQVDCKWTASGLEMDCKRTATACGSATRRLQADCYSSSSAGFCCNLPETLLERLLGQSSPEQPACSAAVHHLPDTRCCSPHQLCDLPWLDCPGTCHILHLLLSGQSSTILDFS